MPSVMSLERRLYGMAELRYEERGEGVPAGEIAGRDCV
jgi:hypothetical protein